MWEAGGERQGRKSCCLSLRVGGKRSELCSAEQSRASQSTGTCPVAAHLCLSPSSSINQDSDTRLHTNRWVSAASWLNARQRIASLSDVCVYIHILLSNPRNGSLIKQTMMVETCYNVSSINLLIVCGWERCGCFKRSHHKNPKSQLLYSL